MAPPETPHVPVLPPPRFFFAAALAAGLFFILWSYLVFNVPALPSFDERCAEFWYGWTRDHHALWGAMVFLTDIGGVASLTLLTVMGSIWQTAIRHRVLAGAWLAVVIGGGLIDAGAKSVFDRDRPPAALRDRAVLQTNESYPSGHSMGSAVGYGMLAYALILPQRRRPRRVVTLLFLTCLVLAIGFSRIFLRAHWFSDVVAGWTIGLAWLFLCIGLLERRRQRTQETALAA
jgi:membrane-associated phospholipid phosphatase